MRMLREKLERYNQLKTGSKESKDLYLDLCKSYNLAGLKPKILSTCYCNRQANIKLITHAAIN